jgi:hypothetical protein
VELRARILVRGVAEGVVGAIANARFESVKRDAAVRVTFKRDSGDTAYCIGATAATSDCDCFERDSAAATYCGIALYPGLDGSSSSTGQVQATNELKGTHLLTDPSGAFDGDATIVFDPKTGTLASLTDGGSLTLQAPALNYRLQIMINALGRATVCVPSGSRAVIGYSSC